MSDTEWAIHDECEQSVIYLDKMACDLIENGEGCACRSAFLRACEAGNYPAACPHREELLKMRGGEA